MLERTFIAYGAHTAPFRYRRRDFVISRELMNIRDMHIWESKMSREERELHHRLRVFMQVCDKSYFERFVEGLLYERQIRARIELLQRWRKNG